MGREVRRADIGFDWPLGKVWWGYVLEGIPCQTCSGTGQGTSLGEYGNCLTCEGEGNARVKITPPAWPVGKEPNWWSKDRPRQRYDALQNACIERVLCECESPLNLSLPGE